MYIMTYWLSLAQPESNHDFKQNDTRIAVFGSTTQKEALDHGLRIDIMAPTPGTPSMTMALEKYIAEANKGK